MGLTKHYLFKFWGGTTWHNTVESRGRKRERTKTPEAVGERVDSVECLPTSKEFRKRLLPPLESSNTGCDTQLLQLLGNTQESTETADEQF